MGTTNQTTYAQSVIPAWYTNYAQQILSNQNALLQGQTYQPYQGQRIAGLNPTQQQGFDMTQSAATSNQPGMATAMGATAGTLGRSALGAASPFLQRASDQSFLPGAYGALGTAGNLAAQSTNPTGLNMAMPLLGQAGQNATSNIGAYMDPFLDNVVNRYGQLGARTLSEQLIPAATNKYISAGQLGGGAAPSGMMTDTARALRDVQEGVGTQQMQALSQGYNTALGASQTDLARQAQIGQTMGQLGQNQQNIIANAGQQFGQLGASQAGIGQAQQGINANLAGTTGNLYNADTTNTLNAAGQLGAQAGALQQQGLAGANAVTATGNQQQGLQQANLDVAYQNFLAQQGFSQAQINQMAQTLGAIAPAIPQGQVQTTTSAAPSASLGQQLGGAAILGGSGVLGTK
jgi:hypothetical protein